jgi:hypothetical protein
VNSKERKKVREFTMKSSFAPRLGIKPNPKQIQYSFSDYKSGKCKIGDSLGKFN